MAPPPLGSRSGVRPTRPSRLRILGVATLVVALVFSMLAVALSIVPATAAFATNSDDHGREGAVHRHRLFPRRPGQGAVVAGHTPGATVLRGRNRPRGSGRFRYRPGDRHLSRTARRWPPTTRARRPGARRRSPGCARGASTHWARSPTPLTWARRCPTQSSCPWPAATTGSHPSFVTHADQVATTQAAPHAHDPNLIGYFTDSELHWGVPEGTRTPSTHYLSLPAGSPGLAVAQQYVGNPSGFISALATRYFQVTPAALRQSTPTI